MNYVIQVIPKVFPTYFLKIFLWRKNLIVTAGENVKKLVITHLEMSITYIIQKLLLYY